MSISVLIVQSIFAPSSSIYTHFTLHTELQWTRTVNSEQWTHYTTQSALSVEWRILRSRSDMNVVCRTQLSWIILVENESNECHDLMIELNLYFPCECRHLGAAYCDDVWTVSILTLVWVRAWQAESGDEQQEKELTINVVAGHNSRK